MPAIPVARLNQLVYWLEKLQGVSKDLYRGQYREVTTVLYTVYQCPESCRQPYSLIILMQNSMDPDQLASLEAS